jgi:hypothetical protein
MVDYLGLHLPDLEVTWATGDPVVDFAASVAAAGRDDLVHFEDDATLCVDFVARAAEAIGDGRRPVNFFHYSRPQHPEPTESQVRAGIEWWFNVGFFVPAELVPHLASYARSWPNPRGHPRSWMDAIVGDFLDACRRRNLVTVPALVQHTPLTSILHPGDDAKWRISNTFTCPELTGHPYPEGVAAAQERARREVERKAARWT